MKTLIKYLLFAPTIYLQSCNMSKYYANMRISNEEKEITNLQEESEKHFSTQDEQLSKNPQTNSAVNKKIESSSRVALPIAEKLVSTREIKTKTNHKKSIRHIARKMVSKFSFKTKIKKIKYLKSSIKSSKSLNENVEMVLWILAVIAGLFLLAIWYSIDEGIPYWTAFGFVCLDFFIGLAGMTLLIFLILKAFGYYD